MSKLDESIGEWGREVWDKLILKILELPGIKPDCLGSNPSYQAQAENDCRTCPFESDCSKTSEGFGTFDNKQEFY